MRKANAVGWLVFVLGELAFFVSCRTEEPLWRASHVTAQRTIAGAPALATNRRLWGCVVGSVFYTFFFVFTPYANDALDMLPIPFEVVCLALCGVAVNAVGAEAAKVYYRRSLDRFQRSERGRAKLTRFWTEGGTAR